jgi:hypothetical protein
VRTPNRERLSAQRPLVAANFGTRGYHGSDAQREPRRAVASTRTYPLWCLFPKPDPGGNALGELVFAPERGRVLEFLRHA